MQDIPTSASEDHGIALLTDSDRVVYSVGISTGGVAEMRMAQSNPKRHIIATTIDQQGVDFAAQRVKDAGLAGQIECKLEDVSKPLPYDDNHFDYIYARLVLHYLTEQELQATLQELRRVLKRGGKLYVVVRSTDCPDAKRPDNDFDPVTHLTTAHIISASTGKPHDVQRFFHTKDSISGYVNDAAFSIDYVKAYDEQLYSDFQRTVVSTHTDNVIELLARK